MPAQSLARPLASRVMDQFHLSIPALDLDATQRWYVEGLGCVAAAAAPMP
jgi:extradiol dioxygenase family protein